MTDIATLVAGNFATWTGAIERRSGAGRGGGKRISLYGVERLRALILELAVRGRLVSQNASDESASELLKQIAKNAARMVRNGELRKPRDLAEGSGVLEPFPIPQTWRWVRLDTIGAIIGGGTPSSTDAGNFAEPGDGVPWITPADLGGRSDLFISRGSRDLSARGMQTSSATVMPKGTVLFTSRAPIGYVAIAANPVSTNQGFKSIVPYVPECSTFIATVMKAFAPEIDAKAPGTTFKEVSGKIVSAIPFPLPPLAEQKRIVAKVDELMALCDRLEEESASALEAHQRLVETLLATLVDSPDATTLATNWSRLEPHFDTLFTTDASIEALKQAILDLAARGLLVNQIQDDEAAEHLLKKVVGYNAKRVSAGISRKIRGKEAKNTQIGLFNIPKNWIWVNLNQIAYKITDGAHQTPNYVNFGVPFLSVKDMSSGVLDFSETRFISEVDHDSLYRRCNPEKGDLLITKIGTTGVPVIVDTDRPFSLFVSVALVKAPWHLISVEYLRMLIDAPFVRRQSAEGTQGVGNKNLVLRTIGEFQLPIAPLAEQHRIVAKVDQLMALCDTLKSRLSEAGETQKHLADAIVERAAA